MNTKPDVYYETAESLTILTQGGGDMLYGRKGEEIHRMKSFPVEVKSTWGAGDAFKAGCVWRAALHDG